MRSPKLTPAKVFALDALSIIFKAKDLNRDTAGLFLILPFGYVMRIPQGTCLEDIFQHSIDEEASWSLNIQQVLQSHRTELANNISRKMIAEEERQKQFDVYAMITAHHKETSEEFIGRTRTQDMMYVIEQRLLRRQKESLEVLGKVLAARADEFEEKIRKEIK